MIEQLELLKQLLGIDLYDSSRDEIINHYIKKARSNILGYCNIESLPVAYDAVVVDYALYLYKNKDSVGLVQKQEGERSASYEPGIPQSIRLALPLPRIKVGY
ncbi:phage head-tail connector protein [Paenibacillus crassostreae]|uniref:DNA-packaging protein n=1 Tax=Paenibacillus crassostreae TaxID=1763538 RepID=A0A167AUW2_9BACL|nr:phage head-tail connector protein [Paenibacillus crassostreae]AOZ93632.1 DNA-packaging protein [Paenibacillus crassostreae]OAB71459.1 DNA-packaging protein [Paenibacillus crassostreae]